MPWTLLLIALLQGASLCTALVGRATFYGKDNYTLNDVRSGPAAQCSPAALLVR